MGIARPVDLTHTARPQQINDLVRVQFAACGERHGERIIRTATSARARSRDGRLRLTLRIRYTKPAPLMATTSSISVVVPPERLLSLDVLRGLTMAAMVLVNDPGSNAIYEPLDHAEWNGATPTDLIFPCFMVIVGVAMTLSFGSRLARGATHRSLAFHAVRRGGLIVLIGVALNALPTFHFATLRLPGVLQRIGVCYILASLLYLALPGPDDGRWRRQREIVLAVVTAVLLAGYWALLKLYPTPGFGPGRLDSLGSLPAVIDRAVFGVHHVYRWATTPGYGPTYDPEGVLSTMPALANILLGILAGEQLRSHATRERQCGVLATMGTALWLAGLTLSHWLPLNKKIWTSTFVLFTSGLSILLLAGLLYLIDIRRVRRGWTFFLIFGTNAILAYILADVVAITLDRVHVSTPAGPLSLHGVIYRRAFASWLEPHQASLGFALGMVGLIAALVYPFYRRRVFLRL